MTIWKTNIADPNLKIVSMDFTNPPNDANPLVYTPQKSEVIGIGFETTRDGTWLRAAVEMRATPSLEEMSEAVSLLFKAYTDPENSDIKVVRGDGWLTPNAMKTTDLIESIKSKSQ